MGSFRSLDRVRSVISRAAQGLCALAAVALALFAAHCAHAALPAGYVELESITSTGSQYIKTGMKPGTTTTVEMYFNTGPNGTDTTFFGQDWNASQYIFAKKSDKYAFYGNGGQVSPLNPYADAHVSITDENKFIIDYGSVAYTTTVSRAASSSAFNIFADSGGGHKGVWTLYSMKIWNGGTPMRDFVPARRESDNAVGLYDLVGDTFYANSGSGAFISDKSLYHIPGGDGEDPGGTSSFSGTLNGTTHPKGWAESSNSVTRIRDGITGSYEKYYFWFTNQANASCHWLRTPNNASYATPATSEIILLPKSYVHFLNKSCGTGTEGSVATLTFNNVTMGRDSTMNFLCNSNGRYNYTTRIGGSFVMDKGATIRIISNGTGASDGGGPPSGVVDISATVSGKGTIVSRLINSSTAAMTILTQKMSGDFSGFTGDLVVFRHNLTYPGDLIHELVNANSIPADPAPGETAYVVVTNQAVLQVDHNWDSGVNRIWNFGDSGVPTINVAAGKTVTIRGELLGSIGFNKTGAGTLVLANPKAMPITLSGSCTFSAAELAAYQRDCRYGITVRLLEHENAPGAMPAVAVSNLVTGAILEGGVDYSVDYFDYAAPGFGHAVVTGLNDYSGYVSTNDFDIVLESAPSGYRQCDWLYVDNTATTPTSWIDTGVTPSGDWKIQIDFAVGSLNSWAANTLICSRKPDGSNTGKIMFFCANAVNSGGTPRIGMGDDSWVDVTSINSEAWAGEHTYLYDNGKTSLDGTLCATASSADFTAGGRSVLFASYHSSATPNGNGFTGAFREAKFHDGSGNLRLHLVPCVRESDGAIGVYNLGAENHGFMDNGGSGSFAVDGAGLALVKNGSFENSTSSDGKQSSGNWGYMHRTWGEGAARTALWSGSAALTKSNCADWYVPAGFHVGTWCAAFDGGPVNQKFYCSKPVKARLTFKYMRRTNVNYDKGVAVIVSLDGGPICSVDIPPSVSTVFNYTLDDVIIPYSPSGHTIAFSKSGSGNYFLDNVALVVTEMIGVSGNLELSVPTSAELAPGETLQCAVTNTTTGAALVVGEDYVITTEEVIASSSSSLAGCWRVIATGQGDYAGQAATNYTRVALKEDAEDYDYAMAITPNASYVTSTLVDFPLLVRLSSTRQPGFSPADCGAGGANLRFILADGTVLAHEVDCWNPTGESTVWVRVPALAADTVIYALWSPKSGTVHHLPRNPKAVWCDYVGVWHMSEASGALLDSSQNGWNATNDASPAASISAAKVGLARQTSASQSIGVSNLVDKSHVKPLSNRSVFVASGWFRNVDGVAKYVQAFRTCGSYQGNSGGFMVGMNNSLTQFYSWENNGLGYTAASAAVTHSVDIPNSGSIVSWTHFTVIYNGTALTHYLNGVKAATYTLPHPVLAPASGVAASPMLIGNDICATDFDELRLRDGVVSDAWALADYRNMATQGFVSYGAIGKKTFSVPALADVTLPDVSVAATPAVAPVDDLTGDALTLGTDYTLVYADNTFGNVTAKAIVTGIGKYEGCVATNTFEILGVASTNLAADADWSAYANPRIAASATIDLKGHTLRVSALYAGGTVTDSEGGGQLIFDVPAGRTVTINTALTGALKLVKTGAGVLVASKAGQTYTGGTDVLGGVLRTGGGAATDGWLGPNTSTVRCKVYVGPDGVLDPAGSYGWGYHAVTLDGGMVSNTVARTGTSSVCFNPSLSTVGDISLVTTGDYSWTSAGGDLGGATMTIENYNHVTIYPLYWNWSNGTIDFRRGGWLNTSRGAIDIRTCDLRQTGGALNVANALSVRDYYCSFGGDYYEGSAALNVYGTFTPASTYFYGPTMQNGSSIDLGSKSGAWSTTSPNNGNHNGNKVVKFASNARVGIGLGERTFSGIEKVVSYTSERSTVTFTNNEWVLSRREDGVYAVGSQAPGAPILPPVIPVQYIRGGQPAEPELSLVNAFTGVALVKGTDYTAAFEDNETQGTASVTVTGQGAYAGLAFTERFTIVQALAAAAAVPPPARMDGTIDWSGVAVTDAGTGAALVAGVDYTYTYTLSGSTATATITGIGNYVGNEIVSTFEIAPRAYFTDFCNRFEITVGEGMVTTELTDFPALVRLSAAAIDGFDPAECGEGGSEIGFLMENGGELLPCEVDYWNPEGESTVWVKVPSLTSATKIYAVYGRRNGRAAIAPSPKKVWGDYAGVWHFSEASGIARDSSPNGWNTTNNGGGTVSNLNSKVGLARNTNGTALQTAVTSMIAASNERPISNVSKFTISGWMFSTANLTAAAQLMNKGVWGSAGWYAQFQSSSTVFAGIGSGTTRTNLNLPMSVYNNWVYMTVVYNGGTCSVYENGSLVSSPAINTVQNSTTLLTLAGGLPGRIDEYRIRDGVEAAAYIAADYKTMNEPGFFEYGAVRHWRSGSVYYIR